MRSYTASSLLLPAAGTPGIVLKTPPHRVASAMEPIAPRAMGAYREPFRSLSGERHKTSWPLGPRPPLRARGGGGRGLRRDGERE
jgi:hypothetical protein